VSSLLFAILSYRAFHLPIADLFLVAFCLYLAFKLNTQCSFKPIISVANFSYTLYIVHFPILLFGRSLSDPLELQSISANLLLSLMITASVLAFSWQTAQWVERPKFFQQKLRQLWP
jgi:peptidoglycan/LPS O-acetylase OafA/YrhL